MQFGGNSVPYLKDTAAVERASRYFKGQLNVIKRLRPNAMIIVIGPSDMSTLIEEEFRTYPLLPLVVDQLRKVTKERDGAYFDMYSAMGGEDAMAAWVEKGLAGQDHIHFTPKGASIAAQKFYDAFMTTYNELTTVIDSHEEYSKHDNFNIHFDVQSLWAINNGKHKGHFVHSSSRFYSGNTFKHNK